MAPSGSLSACQEAWGRKAAGALQPPQSICHHQSEAVYSPLIALQHTLKTVCAPFTARRGRSETEGTSFSESSHRCTCVHTLPLSQLHSASHHHHSLMVSSLTVGHDHPHRRWRVWRSLLTHSLRMTLLTASQQGHPSVSTPSSATFPRLDHSRPTHLPGAPPSTRLPLLTFLPQKITQSLKPNLKANESHSQAIYRKETAPCCGVPLGEQAPQAFSQQVEAVQEGWGGDSSRIAIQRLQVTEGHPNSIILSPNGRELDLLFTLFTSITTNNSDSHRTQIAQHGGPERPLSALFKSTHPLSSPH